MVGSQDQFFIYQSGWQKFDNTQLKQINNILNNKFKAFQDTLFKATQINWRSIPFYNNDKAKNLQIMRLRKSAKDLNPLYFLFDPQEPEDLIYLDGTSPPIYKANEVQGLNITKENLIQYLYFFCIFVHGGEGPFLIVNKLQYPFFKSNTDLKTQIKAHKFPVQFIEENEQGHFLLEAPVLYANSFFKATFLVHKTGMIEMLEDEPIGTLREGCQYQPIYFPLLNQPQTIEHIQDDDNVIKFMEIKELEEREKVSEGYHKEIFKKYINVLKPRRGYLPLARIHSQNIDHLLTPLKRDHPHFISVIDYLQQQLMMSVLLDKGTITPSPILIEGEAGIGKTRFFHDLAKLLSTHFECINCGNLTAGFELAGASMVWKTGKPGKILEAIINAKTANPIVMLDEIDKLALDGNNNVEGPLYSLLESVTAKHFKDEAIGIECDCSHVIWVATCNEHAKLPVPIQSRFERFKVEKPDNKQKIPIVHSIYQDIITENRWGSAFKEELSQKVAIHIAESDAPPRLMKKILQNACAQATTRYHMANQLNRGGKINLLTDDVTNIEIPRERSIGFI